jgi:hypothetical protein
MPRARAGIDTIVADANLVFGVRRWANLADDFGDRKSFAEVGWNPLHAVVVGNLPIDHADNGDAIFLRQNAETAIFVGCHGYSPGTGNPSKIAIAAVIVLTGIVWLLPIVCRHDARPIFRASRIWSRALTRAQAI